MSEPLGREVSALTERMRHLERTQEEQTVMIREIRDFMVSAKGSWKTIMGVAGASAAVGGVAVKIVGAVFPTLPK